MIKINISLELKPKPLQEERAKLHPIRTAKQFKVATLSLEKLKGLNQLQFARSLCLGSKNQRGCGLAQGASGRSSGDLGRLPWHNSHMELSDLDMVPRKRSNQMAPKKRSNQMALRDRCHRPPNCAFICP